MKCFICGNEKRFKKLFPELSTEKNHLCMVCGLVFIPRKEGVFKNYYKDDGYYEKSPNIAARSFLFNKCLYENVAQEKVRKIKDFIQMDLRGKKVLDVGCGYGELLHVLSKQDKCDVLGIEPSKETALIGEEAFKIRIIPILLNEYKGRDKFDLVICNHTLEHLDSPKDFLNDIRNIIKKKGLLYLEVPNVFWPSGGMPLKKFFYNEHLQTFSKENLSLLLSASGFSIENYSDKDFLRFVCAVSEDSTDDLHKQSTEDSTNDLHKQSPEDVYTFLKNYKETYNISKIMPYYYAKLIYLFKWARSWIK